MRAIVPHVRLIHSVASDSALRELARHRELARPGLEILIEVNVAREPGKAGVLPEQLEDVLERAPLPVAGLMTMPPLAADPEDSRRWFAALRELAARRAARALDGHEPGLSGRGRRGRDDRADRREALCLD